MPKELIRLLGAAALLTSAALGGEIPLSGPFYTGAPWGQEQPQAASDGTNFLVAWRDNRTQTPPETIYAARVSSDGRLLDAPTAIRIPDPHDTLPTGWTNTPPAVVWTGGVYIVAWQDYGARSMRIVRIDVEGRVLDARPRSIPNVDWMIYGAAASAGNRALVVYETHLLNSSVHAALFDTDGNVMSADIPLPHGQVDDQPAVASNDESFYVTWRRWEGGTQSLVMGARVARDGTVGEARLIAPTFTGPAIASNGEDYLIAYIDAQKRLAIQHMDRGGSSISQRTLPYSISWPFVGTVIARYRNGYVLSLLGLQRHVTGEVLDREGQPVGAIPVTTYDTADGTIALAANANATLAAWPEMRFGGTVDRDIFCRLVGMPAADTLLSPAAARQRHPRIAVSPSGYLAVWLEYRGPGDGELRATRLSPAGMPIDSAAIKIADHVWDPPAVTFDGRNFVVAWLNRYNGPAAILINRITPDGVLLDGESGRVAVPGYQYAFGLGSNTRESLLVWSGLSENFSPYLRAARIASDGSIDSLVELPTNQHGAGELTVASTGDTWLIAWSEAVPRPGCGVCLVPPPSPDLNVLAARLNNAFNLLDAIPITISTKPDVDERHASVASNGTDFLIAWDERTGFATTVHARVVSAGSGATRDRIEIAVGAQPSIAWLGNDYAIAWEYLGDLFYTRVKMPESVLPLAASPDDESGVAILGAMNNAFIAAYERVATERIYGGVARIFVRIEAAPNRLRRVRH